MARSKKNWTDGTEGATRFLRCIPHLNEVVDVEYLDDGCSLLEVELDRPWYMVPPLTWVMPFEPVRRIQLDRLGTSLLRLCDGRRSAENMIEIFATTHKLSFREAQIPVTRFLRQLTRRGIVVLVGSDEVQDES